MAIFGQQHPPVCPVLFAGEREHHLPFAHRLAFEFERLQRDPGGELDRGIEPQRFLDRPGRHAFRVGAERLPLFRVSEQGEHAVADQVDRGLKPRAQVAGPHFEALCRSYATLAGADLFGELPAEVGHGTVNDSAERAQMQIDVAVFAAPSPGEPRRILSLGEAKWGEVMGPGHLARLARARDLLAAKKYDTRSTTLTCYSAAEFDSELRDMAERDPEHVVLIGPQELYRGLNSVP